MTDPAIGKSDVQQQVHVHIVPAPGGGKLRFTRSDGQYLGSVEFDAVNTEAIGVMGNLFQQFAAQQSGGIQMASGIQIPGLRS